MVASHVRLPDSVPPLTILYCSESVATALESERSSMPPRQPRATDVLRPRGAPVRLFQGNHDSIAAESEHEAFTLGLEMHDYAGPILQPQIARTTVPKREPDAALRVGTRELGQRRQLVNFTGSTDRRRANAADPKAS